MQIKKKKECLNSSDPFYQNKLVTRINEKKEIH